MMASVYYRPWEEGREGSPVSIPSDETMSATQQPPHRPWPEQHVHEHNMAHRTFSGPSRATTLAAAYEYEAGHPVISLQMDSMKRAQARHDNMRFEGVHSYAPRLPHGYPPMNQHARPIPEHFDLHSSKHDAAPPTHLPYDAHSPYSGYTTPNPGYYSPEPWYRRGPVPVHPMSACYSESGNLETNPSGPPSAGSVTSADWATWTSPAEGALRSGGPSRATGRRPRAHSSGASSNNRVRGFMEEEPPQGQQMYKPYPLTRHHSGGATGYYATYQTVSEFAASTDYPPRNTPFPLHLHGHGQPPAGTMFDRERVANEARLGTRPPHFVALKAEPEPPRKLTHNDTCYAMDLAAEVSPNHAANLSTNQPMAVSEQSNRVESPSSDQPIGRRRASSSPGQAPSPALSSSASMLSKRHGLCGRPSNRSKKPETKHQFIDFVKARCIMEEWGPAKTPTYRLAPPLRRIQGDGPDSLRAQFNKEQERLSTPENTRETISNATCQVWFKQFFGHTSITATAAELFQNILTGQGGAGGNDQRSGSGENWRGGDGWGGSMGGSRAHTPKFPLQGSSDSLTSAGSYSETPQRDTPYNMSRDMEAPCRAIHEMTLDEH